MSGRTSLQPATDQIRNQVIGWRRHLHRHPELSFEEIETSRFVRETLESFPGLEISNPTPTSVMARLAGNKPGKTLAIRADMDALPITEENDFEFRSIHPGKMHACGHDGHTAILLGAASVLSGLKDEIPGEIRFIFQHGEEQLPGGADEMVRAGVMDGVDAVIGAHLWSPIETGNVFTKAGPLMAAADIFRIQIRGQGGHSAVPHETIDALAVGTQVVNNLQHILSRQTDPFESLVVSVTKFTAGTSHSIIPDTAEIVGSVRSFNEGIRRQVPAQMERIIGGVTAAHGATYELDYEYGYSPVLNDEAVTRMMEETVREVLGEEHLLRMNPMMISEDFSRYQKEAPGCFFLIGAGNQEKGIVWPHHHPKFTIDEESLDIGVRLFVDAALRILGCRTGEAAIIK
ncbi:amidohydrolase [Edaphobacillus lindanitolerans]|uniref:Amidohydrolase n=1 Tax=Edaphobacillus lindanitolerans TaxID=550447 RepID=A0A1U7PND6_9BACI|nr:amidohydrolase [Edaphobacillus lindanitolerans]SIT72367.1 amidohydrolase [Edaphobacillus lindanitolerans]